MGSQTTPLKTVLRAFEILELLEREREAGPSEVADHLEVTRATAHDYLTTLETAGYLVNDDGRYRIGYRLLGLGSRVKYRDSFFNAARAPLRKLSADTGELSHIGIEEAGEYVLLHHEGDVSTVDMGTYPGLRFPLHAHAAGKVIVAHMSDDHVEELLRTKGLEQITDFTITDEREFLDELDRIVENGYAADSDELNLGVGLIAAPVVVDGDPIGSISIACPSGRFQNADYRDRIVQRVAEAADEISINYRYSM
ncbi:IclR family transcriptional regulator [Halobacterium bonnevillei]|uniref:Helix-turn-helix domain-containing protein n=1 Tax=Halobacterium bonnevillei TaxID=2692200 RepID=A0A6B0SCG4_9EURY|nr:IclR family transcriptional regulator [Halobacterium bonnevillei]MXR19354.1 helix-turn-helix domain-containing protein [Halobacterium bonnevillei]